MCVELGREGGKEAESPVPVQPGAEPLQTRSAARRSRRSDCVHPVLAAGQGGEADM